MGSRLSTPDHAVQFADLLSTQPSTLPPTGRRPAHANLVIAWRFPGTTPVPLPELTAFDPTDAIVVLRVYDEAELRRLEAHPLLRQVLDLCRSGAKNLNAANAAIPLNVVQPSATFSDGLKIRYRIYAWTGVRVRDADRCAAESKAFELVLALGDNAAILERLWKAPSSYPFQDATAPGISNLPENVVFVAVCGCDVSPLARPKESLQLDLAGIAPAVGAGPLTATTQHLIGAGLSEEQQKMALLEHYAPQSSLIEPNLFLSGVAVSHDFEHLTARGITHIVNAALDACRNEFPDKFTYLGLRLSDSKHEDIICRIYDVIEFIETAFSKPHHKVLVHCHRGISRSATLVIAYLMVKRAMTFNEAFNLVKSRRDIVSPNIGFSVALIQWHRRLLFGAQDAPILYRITSFSPTRDPLCLVGKITDLGAGIDSRGVYVFQTAEAIYVWIGACSQRLFYAYAKQTLIPRLQRFEKGSSRVVDEHDGAESAEFLALFGERKGPFSDGCVAAFDEEYKTMILPLSDPGERLAGIRSGSMSHRPLSTTPAVTTPITSHSERDQVDSEPIRIAGEESGFAAFYSWPCLQEIEVFGPEDLSDQCVFVFLKRRARSRSANLYIWAGTEVDLGPDPNEFVATIAKDCIGRLRMQDLETTILYEEAGNESDEFWDLF